MEFVVYAFVKRTRRSQKISKVRGSMVRTKYKPVLKKAAGRCCPIPTGTAISVDGFCVIPHLPGRANVGTLRAYYGATHMTKVSSRFHNVL